LAEGIVRDGDLDETPAGPQALSAADEGDQSADSLDNDSNFDTDDSNSDSNSNSSPGNTALGTVLRPAHPLGPTVGL
jgi:hypothetical protein